MPRRKGQQDRHASDPKLATNRASVESGIARKSGTSNGSLARGFSRLHPKSVRVRPRRKTEEIDLPTARDACRAIQHAMHVGRPINRHLTVCWQLAGVSDGLEATSRLMKLICDGARRRGHRVSYLWVRETGQTVGDHVHILFHLPEPLVGWYRKRKSGWLRRCGATFTEGTSKTTRVRGSTPVVTGVVTRSELYEDNLKKLGNYVLKHCSRATSKALRINDNGPNLLIGKRVSISQDLHRKGRQECALCKG
jgi:hypothetical protein